MQAAVQVTSPQICSCADLCILQQNVNFHCSSGIKAEPGFTVTSWKKTRSASSLDLSYAREVRKLILLGFLIYFK